MPPARVFMNKHVLNDRPSRGVAILWTSFEPRWDLVWVQCSRRLWHHTRIVACIAFLSGYNSSRFRRRTAQLAWSASPTSLSDAWLAARCFHPLHARNICAV